MRILFLTPYLPSPARTGGARRMQALIRGLARRHEVTILSQGRDGWDDADAVRATGEYCRQLVVVPNPVFEQGSAHKRRLQLRSLVSPRSFEQLAYGYPAYQAALDELIARNDFDLVAVEFSVMAYVRLPQRPLLVLDEHNIEYDIHLRTAQAATQRVRKLYSQMSFLKLRHEERRAWRRFDGIVLTSERDRQILRRDFSGAQTCVVPNGVDTEYFRPGQTPPRNDVILFFGAIDYYPNTQGLLYFFSDIWPALRLRHPSLKLMVVGQSPPESILAFRSSDIVVTGLVDDIRPYIAEASAVIVPLQIGGGTRLKILEAMAMGKAIVSTSIGAEGIDVTDDHDILIADTPEDFTGQLTRILRDPALRDALGQAARELVVTKYEWDVGVRTLEAFYGELRRDRASVPEGVALAYRERLDLRGPNSLGPPAKTAAARQPDFVKSTKP